MRPIAIKVDVENYNFVCKYLYNSLVTSGEYRMV